ncbi:hypothetical protein Syun_030054 [Stephania yunnanensis]|uniref:Cytochrome oxidase complex assembly protein 1 n=1 Tax=Stephania yunnanensis TaxID=152371 RepID=A0AAP0HLY3_9MAGN
MGRKRLISGILKIPQLTQSSSNLNFAEKGKSQILGRKAVQVLLLSLTGGVALSALDDLAIYRSCSSKAMEKATQSQEILSALGDPIVKGPWYNASLAVAHKRHSVSCSFPISGPRGSGIFQLKAIRDGDDSWFSFLRPREWNVLVMEALLHIPENDEKNQTLRISLSDSLAPTSSKECIDCRFQQSSSPDNR